MTHSARKKEYLRSGKLLVTLPAKKHKMGQASSSRREAGPSRESSIPEARSSGGSINTNDSEECFALTSPHMLCQDLPDLSVPIQNWLSMDSTARGKHALHAKHCILTPYFLFSKEDEDGGKLVSWLQQKQLIPKPSSVKLLSDKHINVVDCAEKAVDMILLSMNSSCFLYDVFHVVEQTKECHFLSDALRMAKNCHLIEELLCNFSKFFPGNKIPREDTGLIILVLLNQAMSHIQRIGDQTDAFEKRVKDNSGKCDALKLKGNALFNAKKYNKACMTYSQAIKLRPFDAVLYGNRAQSYLSAARYREALSDARRAICLNPSWEKGHFRYAKAYYHLGFHDKAIAINLQAQKKCSQTEELIQQAALFTKGRSCSPSPQPTNKRQRISTVEPQDLPCISDEDEGEYSDLPELIQDDSEDELDKPGPSSRKDKACGTSIMNKSSKPEDGMNSKRVQCLCSPRTPLSRKLRRASSWHDLDHHDDRNEYRKDIRTVSKSLQGKNPGHVTSNSSQAYASSSAGHDDRCTDREATWAKDTSLSSSALSCRSLVNHHYIYDNADDTRDLATQGNTNNDPMKSKTILSKKGCSSDSSRTSQCVLELGADNKNSPVVSIDSRCESTSSTYKTSDLASSEHHLCSDKCKKSSSSLSANGKTNSSHGTVTGVQRNSDYNTSEEDDDEHQCICGLCPVSGDDDEWEDIDDDDDDDDDDNSLTDLDFTDEDETTEDEEDDDMFFDPFFHMLGSMMPSAPIPPRLVLGSEIFLLTLIRQFLESHSEFQSEDTPPGALPEVIESLIKKKATKEIIESSASCCICQNDYMLDEMITCLPCNHVYHGPCITTWLKMHATCPTCRDVLPH